MIEVQEPFVSQDLDPGDFLIFQLESGYGLLRLLAVDDRVEGRVWHLAAYGDLFLDIETADAVLENPPGLTLTHSHLALTNRAFESTQVARMKNVPLTESELRGLDEWTAAGTDEVFDRSIRLLLGIR